MGCPSPARALLTLLAAGLLAASLSGCGRRGPLEAPLDPAVKAAPAVGEAATSAGDAMAPVARRPKRSLITPPKDPFILDPLL